MDNKLVISYTPEQIDEAVKQHIACTTGYTGSTSIEYTHKRKLKKVSAEITLVDPVKVSNLKYEDEAIALGEVSEDPYYVPGLAEEEANYINDGTVDLEGDAHLQEEMEMEEPEQEDEATAFEELPLHEQQEATGHVETDELEDIVEHMQEEEEDDMESLFK